MVDLMKSVCLVVITAILLSGCKKIIDPASQTGDLYVSVYYSGPAGYGPAANANVYTKPQSVQGVTDEFGSLLLKGIPGGSFEVFASLSSVGSGKAVTKIKKDSLTKVEIYIIKGVNAGISPEIKLVLPALPASFSKEENITFSADISDQDSAPKDITVKWESNLDGVINTSSPNQNGNVSFSKTLSKGLHKITVTATDKDKYTGTFSFDLSTLAPKPVELVSATKQESGISLLWKKYTGDDFKSYEIYRGLELNSSNNTLVATVNDLNTTVFADSMAPFTPEVFYFIKVVTKEENWSNSNSVKVENPAGAVFFFSPADVVMHPTLNRLYFVDKGANKLRVIDLDKSSEIASVSLQGTPGYIDIGDNGLGMEVYVPSSDGWIYAYDADKLSQKKSISTGLPTPCVVTNGHGYVAASVTPSPWWEGPVRTYSRATGINISGDGGFEGDRLRFVPGQEKIISISRSVSPTDMEYFELNKKGEILVHKDDTQHGSYPLDANIFRISGSGEYVVTGAEGAVYLAAESMEYKGQIQRGSLMYSDFAFSEDSKTIYAATQNRKSIQIARYPQLTRDNEILLRGIPKFVFYRAGKLIVVSLVNDSSTSFGIEIIKVK
jgi:hypothetical protein